MSQIEIKATIQTNNAVQMAADIAFVQALASTVESTAEAAEKSEAMREVENKSIDFKKKTAEKKAKQKAEADAKAKAEKEAAEAQESEKEPEEENEEEMIEPTNAWRLRNPVSRRFGGVVRQIPARSGILFDKQIGCAGEGLTRLLRARR